MAPAAAAGGAVVTAADDSTTPIPLLLSPVGVPAETFARISDDAHALVGALVKLTRRLMRSRDQQPFRGLLFGRFAAVETAGLAGWQNAERLATARVDFLVGQDGRHRALEVNATIPAMQGYSDAVANAWLDTVAAARGLASPATENGSNGDDLLASLTAHHETRQAGPLRSIAIVARAHDAQLGELRRYVQTWSERGHDVELCTPADFTIDADGTARTRTPPPRPHLSSRLRAPPHRRRTVRAHVPRAGALRHFQSAVQPPRGQRNARPPVGRARLGPRARGHRPDRRRASHGLRRILPWTRLVYPQTATLPDGSRRDMQSFVRAHGPELVLKRNWDYGGKGVFLGADLDGQGTQARLAELTGLPTPIDWPTLSNWAFDGSEEAWVVQSLVPVRQAKLLLVGADDVVAHPLYVDLSAFTNYGVAARPRGGAARAAFGRIVNIQGGGGLAPVVMDEILAKLA